MIHDSIKAIGEVNFKLYDCNGTLIQEIDRKNLIVAIGKSFIASRIGRNDQVPISHMAIGHGRLAASSSDVSLEDEALNGRVFIPTPVVNENVIRFNGIFGPSFATGYISEAGLFNSSESGIMLSRTTFPSITKDGNDTLAITWSILIN